LIPRAAFLRWLDNAGQTSRQRQHPLQAEVRR
jgi:hypothetical protein